jgi:hypothetical protein
MSESYSPLKDFASPQGGATCDTSPLSFNITNHIHHSVEFGQSTVMSPVTMSHFGDHKPEKLKKNEYQAKVKAPKKKGDRKKSAATLMVERDEILQNANEQLGDGNVRLLESNESHLALYGVCKEAVEKSQKQHKQAKSLQTNNMQAHKKIASLEKKLDAKDGTIRKLNIDVTTQKEKKKSAEENARAQKEAFQLSQKMMKEANASLTALNKQMSEEVKSKDRDIDKLRKDNEKLRNDAASKSGADGAAKSNSLQEKLQYELHKGVMQNMLKNEQERNKMENKNKRLATIASGGGILPGGGALSLPTGLSGNFSQYLGDFMVRLLCAPPCLKLLQHTSFLIFLHHFTTQNNSKKSSNARKEFSRGHRHKRHEPSSSSNYSSDSLSDEYTPPRQKSRRRESKSDRREKKRRSRDESRKKKRRSRSRDESLSDDSADWSRRKKTNRSSDRKYRERSSRGRSRSLSPSPSKIPARKHEEKNDESKICAVTGLVDGRNLSRSFLTPAASNQIQDSPHADTNNFITQMSQMNDKNSLREDDNVDPGMYVSPGSIKTMFGMSGATDKPGFQPTVQVLHLKDISHADAANKRWKVTISDGTHYFSGVVAHQLAQMVDSGDITQHAIKSISKGDVCICINKGNV